MKHLIQHIEALIFVAEQPIKVSEIIHSLTLDNEELELQEEVVIEAIEKVQEKFSSDEFAFNIVKSGGGYQFLTKQAYYEVTAHFLNQKLKRRLTSAALETLSIIAYKQPVSKSDIEKIRGVNSDYTVQKLMEKELLDIVGRSDDPGRPLLYGTSQFFMDYFGINDISDLPKLKEFAKTDNQIGEQADIEINKEDNGSGPQEAES